MTAPATARQLAFLAILVEERDWPDVSIPEALTEVAASHLIDLGKARPKLARPPVAPGLYLRDGAVYRVRQSKTTGHAYAEVLVVQGTPVAIGRWKMARGMVNRVSQQLTPTAAIELGRDTGVCHVCGNRLIKDNGIHPGCRKGLETT